METKSRRGFPGRAGRAMVGVMAASGAVFSKLPPGGGWANGERYSRWDMGNRFHFSSAKNALPKSALH